MSAVIWGDSPNVIEVNFHPNAETRNRIAAGSAAMKRALRFGYCRTVAQALARTAKREWGPGETPEACARRIVRRPHETVSPSGPKGAA